ncbi:MAG: hypothetical protein BSOLF_0125 [Candidatus Carbobacillus altaicus]|uniref:Uncharacterized protein n=1 Tax=Candidatus Carbonibacillus altaicus TaxID=2163959 RepID=A0A2R6XXI1_9BACL|nr:MAG: hypothetical protein BSOLF_0125 [Candidatus Carbobacillus altaicus]
MASHFFPRHGAIGTDALIYRDRRGVGRNPVLEIRLKPADSARALLNELHQKLTEVQKYLKYKQKVVANKTIALLAGCAPHPAFSLGGHLHARGVPLTIEWIRRFDLYLALPLLALAPETCAARLKRYGYLGDIRFKPHGGFEYRTLPSWIVDPSLARYVLLMWEALVRSMKQVRQGLIFSATEDAVRLKHHAMIWQKLARLVPHYDPARKEDARRMRTYARTVVGDLYERLQHEDFRLQYERLYNEHLQYECLQQEHLRYERLQMDAPSISSVSMVETMSLKEIFSKEWYMCFLQSLRWMLARLEEGWRWKEQEDIFPRWNAVNSYVGEDR